MERLYISSDYYSETTRSAETDDDWDRGDTSTTWTFNGAYLADETSGFADLDYSISPDEFVEGDTVHAVIAVWSTGDSFGHDAGACAEVMFASKDLKIAEEVYDRLENHNKDKKIDIHGRDIYVPWNGYFENLDYLTVETFTIGSSKRSKHSRRK